MKTTKTLIAFFLVFNIYHPLSAQSNFKDGFVVTNGDTLSGQIDYRQWEKNPSSIRFKNNVGDVVKYDIDDISYFEIPGFDKYKKAIVKKDMRPVGLRDIHQDTEDLYINDTVFLRILVEGKVSLYQLRDDKTHFYIKTDNKNFEELTYKVYLTKELTISRRSIYIDQLLRFVDRSKDNARLISRIQKARYQEEDLTKVVQNLNSQGGESVNYEKKKIKQPISFFAGVGVAHSSLVFKGEKANASSLSYNKTVRPLITVGVDIGILRDLQSLVVRAELSYFSNQFEGNGSVSNFPFTSKANYKFKVSTIAPSVSLLYNVLNSPANKVYLGIGAAGNISSYPQNIYREVPDNVGQPYEESPYLPFEKFWVSTHVKAGWIINKKIEIATSIKVDGSISYFLSNSVSLTMNTLSVNYHF